MRIFTISFLTLLFSGNITLAQYEWKQLINAPTYKGKQDDIYFLNENLGWYVNGSGKIYKTMDGGENWKLIFEKPGTFFRCIGFIDSLSGFAGNIGVDYFPGVTDTVPLYKTTNGGNTWEAVKYSGPIVKGLCAIDILKVPFVNAGILDYKYQITAGGRVGSPAFIMQSIDGGKTFTSKDMNLNCAFILDVKFLSQSEGFICAAAAPAGDLNKSNALILHTTDGGKTWKKRYRSKRPYELTWKMSFPTNKVGYVTIQSYNPDSSVSQRYVAKTTNGGKSWKEIKLVNDYSCREFGVAFIDENIGWIGGMKTGYETLDGGKTWKPVTMGKAVNKIRLLPTKKGFIGYAIGTSVYKLNAQTGK